MLNPKEKLMRMWMEGLTSSEDLEKEIKYHLDMLHQRTLENSSIKWKNQKLNLCVICDIPLTRNSFWICQKCGKPSEITQRHVADDVFDIKSTCCNSDVNNNQSITCSVQCHKDLVDVMILEKGEFKMVTDIHTLKTHKVPLRDIIEKGINYFDLVNYPIVDDPKN